MNFNTKAQSINKFLDKQYSQLLAEESSVNQFDTIAKKCKLETGKLVNYSIGIKEEIKSEIVALSSYKQLSSEERKQLIDKLDTIGQNLRIPEFTLKKEDVIEKVTTTSEGRTQPVNQKQGQSPFVGTAIGTAIGVGVGLIIQKSIPTLLIGGIGGAVVGTMIGVALSSSTSSRKQAAPSSIQETHKYVFNKNKYDGIIQTRKAAMEQLFQQYLKQLEDACQIVLQ